MNIVCDTNILVSGVLFGGHARTIIRMASRGRVTNFVSPHILRELEEVLARQKFGLSSEQVFHIVALARDTFEFVDPEVSINAISTDSDDDRILEAAVCASAELIVSGDKHLLDLGDWEGIQVVTAAVFVKNLAGPKAQEDSP